MHNRYSTFFANHCTTAGFVSGTQALISPLEPTSCLGHLSIYLLCIIDIQRSLQVTALQRTADNKTFEKQGPEPKPNERRQRRVNSSHFPFQRPAGMSGHIPAR